MLLLAAIGALGEAGPAQVLVFLAERGFAPVLAANTGRVLNITTKIGYTTSTSTHKGTRIMYKLTEKGKERLAQERSLVLKIADLIDLVVPP